MENSRRKTKPFFVAIEGLDGSGKFTTSNALKDFLNSKGFKATIISFPMYEKWHSFLVRWHLAGKFGKNAATTNPYISSLCYTVDRFFAWHFGLKKKLREYDFVIFDRYVTSNMVYQSVKAKNPKQRRRIINFNKILEYDILGLPRPSLVIGLTTSLERSLANVISRKRTSDIYETDVDFLAKTRNSFMRLANEEHWFKVETTLSNGEMLPVEYIVNKIAPRVIELKLSFDSLKDISHLLSDKLEG